MLKKALAGIGFGMFMLAATWPLQAQEVATLALRNGERPSGQLIDLNASGFILDIGGQVRQFSPASVAAVEFVVGPLPAAAQTRASAGQPFVLLRNGQVIDGRLSDIGGKSPLRLTVDTSAGPRDFMSNEVAQVWINSLNGAAAGQPAPGQPAPGRPSSSAPTPAPAGSIAVAANQPWTDTGISLVRGQKAMFVATGDIMTSASASSGPGGSPAATVPGARYPVPGAPVGALIGRIGTGTPFLIGSSREAMASPATGRLMLGVNDDQFGDNSGQYFVTVQRLAR